jgi:hypothetical protein
MAEFSNTARIEMPVLQRWTVDGALLLDSPDHALIHSLNSLTSIKSIWAVNPRLSLQKWCYRKNIPWFYLVEGLQGELWRWPLSKNIPSVLIVRYRPELPFNMARVQSKLMPLFNLCAGSMIPLIIDRQAMPPFLCRDVDLWFNEMMHQFPLMQIYPLSMGDTQLGALRGSPNWMRLLEEKTLERNWI